MKGKRSSGQVAGAGVEVEVRLGWEVSPELGAGDQIGSGVGVRSQAR